MHHRFALTSVTLALVGALLAACGTDPDAGSEPSAKPGYPITVDNCGTQVTFDRPPRRTVTVKSTSTELLLALGLEDSMVGRAFSDGPLPARWAEKAKDIPALSSEAPSQEVVLSKRPDLVYAGWESNLAPETAGDRETLADLGIDSYVSPAACKGSDHQPRKMTFDRLFGQFEEMGAIFGVKGRARSLIDKQRKQLASVTEVKPGTTALWYSSGSAEPYVGGGIGAPQMVLDALGLKNVAGSVNDTWTSMSWEKVASRNPDVIVLVDATWSSARKKISYLRKNPVTSRMDAVRHDRYLRIPFAASEAGVRSVPATVDLGRQLAEVRHPSDGTS